MNDLTFTDNMLKLCAGINTLGKIPTQGKRAHTGLPSMPHIKEIQKSIPVGHGLKK